MPRRNEGPKLKWHRYGAAYYICWTENGRSRERTTGTADREQAEIVFATWLHARGQRHGPSDPSETLITDALTRYATEKGSKVAAPRIIGCAIDALSGFWEGQIISDITPLTCSQYSDWRGRSQNTIRRELAVLRAAVNWGYKTGKLTRSVAVALPAKPDSRKRWLTRQEAAKLLRDLRTESAPLSSVIHSARPLHRQAQRSDLVTALAASRFGARADRLRDPRPQPDQETTRRRTNSLAALATSAASPRAWHRYGLRSAINGSPIRDIKKGFAAACERAGLDDVTPHTLRHTAATWLMQAGVSIWDASGYLSMSAKMLSEVYGHHHPDHMRSAVNALSRKSFRRISA